MFGRLFNLVGNAVYDEYLDFMTDRRVKLAYSLVAMALVANVVVWFS